MHLGIAVAHVVHSEKQLECEMYFTKKSNQKQKKTRKTKTGVCSGEWGGGCIFQTTTKTCIGGEIYFRQHNNKTHWEERYISDNRTANTYIGGERYISDNTTTNTYMGGEIYFRQQNNKHIGGEIYFRQQNNKHIGGRDIFQTTEQQTHWGRDIFQITQQTLTLGERYISGNRTTNTLGGEIYFRQHNNKYIGGRDIFQTTQQQTLTLRERYISDNRTTKTYIEGERYLRQQDNKNWRCISNNRTTKVSIHIPTPPLQSFCIDPCISHRDKQNFQ